MRPVIHIETVGEVSLLPGRPLQDPSTALSGGEQYGADGPWGWVSLEEVVTPRFCLSRWKFAVAEPVHFRVAGADRQVQSLLCRRGQFRHQLSGLTPVDLYEQEFLLFRAREEESLLTALPGTAASLVSVRYHLPLYRSFLPLFRRLREDLAATVRKAGYLLSPPKVARFSIHDTIEAIWLDRYLPELQLAHVELRVQTSLFTQLAQTYSLSDSLPSLLQRQTAAAARGLILQNIRHHHTVEELARAVHCSVPWLKRAFQRTYGTGLFQFLRRTRMEQARVMLLGGESLKAVALEVGMKPRNFPREFKAFFGYTVTALKKGRS